MPEVYYIALSLILIMLASISGVIFLQANFKTWLDRNLPKLVSFSAGVFIFIAFHLTEESLEILAPNISIPTLSVLVGIVIFVLLKKFLPESHHHSEDCGEHQHNKPKAIRMMVGDGIHNIADGIVIIPAFFVDLKLGLITAIGIFIHELLQEISEFFVLRDAGYTTRQALYRNFFVSTTIIIGAAIGLFFAQNEFILGILLGISAGSFLYIVVADLFPYKKLQDGFQTAIKHLLFFITGILFVFILNLLFTH